MNARPADRKPRQETVLACRSVPLPLFALYSVGAMGVTWMAAAWRDRRRNRRLRDEIRSRNRQDEQE